MVKKAQSDARVFHVQSLSLRVIYLEAINGGNHRNTGKAGGKKIK